MLDVLLVVADVFDELGIWQKIEDDRRYWIGERFQRFSSATERRPPNHISALGDPPPNGHNVVISSIGGGITDQCSLYDGTHRVSATYTVTAPLPNWLLMNSSCGFWRNGMPVGFVIA